MCVQENEGKSISRHAGLKGKSPGSAEPVDKSQHSTQRHWLQKHEQHICITSASLIARLGCTAASPRANWGYWCRAALQFRDMVQVGMVGRWQKYCQGWKSHLILVTEHRSRLSSKFPTQKSCPLVSTTQCFLVQEVLPGISPVHSPSGVLAKMAPIGSKTPKKRSSREFLLSRQLCIVVAETIDVARLWQWGLDSSHFNEESSSGA